MVADCIWQFVTPSFLKVFLYTLFSFSPDHSISASFLALQHLSEVRMSECPTAQTLTLLFYIHSRDVLTYSYHLKTTYVLLAPKFISLAQISPLNPDQCLQLPPCLHSELCYISPLYMSEMESLTSLLRLPKYYFQSRWHLQLLLIHTQSLESHLAADFSTPHFQFTSKYFFYNFHIYPSIHLQIYHIILNSTATPVI